MPWRLEMLLNSAFGFDVLQHGLPSHWRRGSLLFDQVWRQSVVPHPAPGRRENWTTTCPTRLVHVDQCHHQGWAMLGPSPDDKTNEEQNAQTQIQERC